MLNGKGKSKTALKCALFARGKSGAVDFVQVSLPLLPVLLAAADGLPRLPIAHLHEIVD